ncbi:mitochondrial carrier domain-containing protein [Entophlyctis helioformis]|nr:mitochondrial carrier domain-containing protein [Entophlyctis helioformis]
MPKKEGKVPAYQSILAGGIAGAIEGTMTYPMEFAKTQLQLQNASSQKAFNGPVDVLVKTVQTKGVMGIYKGLSALVIGNSSKAAVRFLSFEQLRKALADENGKLSGSRMVLAGLGAGVSEAALVVTPSETINSFTTKNQAIPKYRGLVHGVRSIVAEEGVRGIYRGLTAVIARQGANSAVRMTTYGLLKEQVVSRYPADPVTGKQYLPWYISFVNGGIAGIVTVYTTMPLDVVKTRMQGLDAGKYKHSIDCLATVVRTEGVKALWKGSTPRLGRLIFSGGIVFSVYEQVLWAFDQLGL